MYGILFFPFIQNGELEKINSSLKGHPVHNGIPKDTIVATHCTIKMFLVADISIINYRNAFCHFHSWWKPVIFYKSKHYVENSKEKNMFKL